MSRACRPRVPRATPLSRLPRAGAALRRWEPNGVRVEGGTAVTMQPPGSLAAGDIDLSDTAFWGWPAADRQAAFAVLRAREHPAFFAEPEAPFAERGPGYFAFVRHADVTEASRNPEVFCSRRGATSILDLPAEFNEYFGSMINMDDP